VKHIEILSSENQLPEAIELNLLPAQSIEQGIAFWESLEGMLVKSSDANVVAPTTRFGEFVMINEANQEIESGYYSDSGHLLIHSIGEQALMLKMHLVSVVPVQDVSLLWVFLILMVRRLPL